MHRAATARISDRNRGSETGIGVENRKSGMTEMLAAAARFMPARKVLVLRDYLESVGPPQHRTNRKSC